MSKIPYQRKAILGFPGYEIDTGGSIFSCRTNGGKIGRTYRKLKPPKTKYGYIATYLGTVNGRIHGKIHRLVLKTFVGECPEGMEACHNNGIRDDNRLENLRWDTRKNNYADREKHGTDNRGERNGRVKLNKFQVQRIRLMKEVDPTITNIKLGKMFNIGAPGIRKIIKQTHWKHI